MLSGWVCRSSKSTSRRLRRVCDVVAQRLQRLLPRLCLDRNPCANGRCSRRHGGLCHRPLAIGFKRRCCGVTDAEDSEERLQRLAIGCLTLDWALAKVPDRPAHPQLSSPSAQVCPHSTMPAQHRLPPCHATQRPSYQRLKQLGRGCLASCPS